MFDKATWVEAWCDPVVMELVATWGPGAGGSTGEVYVPDARAVEGMQSKMSCMRAVEEAYGPEITSLTDLLIDQLPHKLVKVSVPVGGRSGGATSSSKARAARRAAAAPNEAPRRGFGGGQGQKKGGAAGGGGGKPKRTSRSKKR